MADVMIGAIPAASDPIHAVSSEQVPHLTLLYFGPAEGADLNAIRAAVVRVAQRFQPVTARVLRRGTLGDDKADVLFLDPGDLRKVRSALLADSAVRAAFNAFDQYPHYRPHVTVGYPDTPATGEPGHEIQFDRLALWTGEYEGPEFTLGAVPTPVLTAAVVRTPAGAKKYGQPIGSVIVRDVMPSKRPLTDAHASEWHMLERVWPEFMAWLKDAHGVPEAFDSLEYEGLRREYQERMGSLLDPFTAAGDSWRWQLRDRDGQWIEMGSEVKWLARGLYKKGLVVGSPSPGIASVKEHITGLIHNVPSSRLEVTKSAAEVLQQAIEAGSWQKADLTGLPALQQFTARAQKQGIPLTAWSSTREFLPDELADYGRRLDAATTYPERAPILDEIEKVVQQRLHLSRDLARDLVSALATRAHDIAQNDKYWDSVESSTRKDMVDEAKDARTHGALVTIAPSDAAIKILQEGRFKSQFETSTSGGTLDPMLRAKAELEQHGLTRKIPEKERPIYGLLKRPGIVNTNMDHYGDVMFVFKPSVRKRTTMTMGDSLESGAHPIPVTGEVPDRDMLRATARWQRSAWEFKTGKAYVEAQMHNGVLVDDVAEIRILRDSYMAKQVEQLAAKRGIPVVYTDGSGNPLPGQRSSTAGPAPAPKPVEDKYLLPWERPGGIATLRAAGDSWRWQLRDRNGKWIEMGSEVKWLARGRWLTGTVVGSPSPGMATVEEAYTKILRDLPSARLEVVRSGSALLDRVEATRDEKGHVDWRGLDLTPAVTAPADVAPVSEPGVFRAVHITSPENAARLREGGFTGDVKGLGSDWGKGVYLGTDPGSAEHYQRFIPGGEAVDVDVDLKKPARVTIAYDPSNNDGGLSQLTAQIPGLRDELLKRDGIANLDQPGEVEVLNSEALTPALQALGYDGLVLSEVDAAGRPTLTDFVGGSQIVVFDPSSVKVVKPTVVVKPQVLRSLTGDDARDALVAAGIPRDRAEVLADFRVYTHDGRTFTVAPTARSRATTSLYKATRVLDEAKRSAAFYPTWDVMQKRLADAQAKFDAAEKRYLAASEKASAKDEKMALQALGFLETAYGKLSPEQQKRPFVASMAWAAGPKSGTGGQHVGGVTVGESIPDTMWLNPKFFNDENDPTAGDGWHMPSSFTQYGEYALNHELGHLLDPRTPATLRFFRENKEGLGLSKYGSSKAAEAYAEAFASWQGGNRSLLVMRYAREFGWNEWRDV